MALDDQVPPKQESEEELQQLLLTDEVSVQRHLRRLETVIRDNQKLRVKYENEPLKFMESELSLEQELRILSALPSSPHLVKTFAESDGLKLFVSLLSHNNIDIVIKTINFFAELTDSEVLAESENSDSLRSCIDKLITEFALFALIVENLNRLNEKASPEEYEGATSCMLICQNLIETFGNKCADEITEHAKSLLSWLLKRIGYSAKPHYRVEYNRLFAAELISSLLQLSQKIRDIVASSSEGLGFDGIDALLVPLSEWRKVIPESLQETEFVKNITLSLTAMLLSHPNMQHLFNERQGIQLLIRLLKSESKLVISCALDLLPLVIDSNSTNCNTFVTLSGLPCIFGLFSTTSATSKSRELESIMGSICSLVSYCTGQSQGRVWAKFIEDDFSKFFRLLEIHKFQKKRLNQWERELQMDTENPWTPATDYSKSDSVALTPQENNNAKLEDQETHFERASNGLSVLEFTDNIILHLCMTGSAKVTSQIHDLLSTQLVEEAAATIREYLHNWQVQESDSRAIREWTTLRKAVEEFVSGHAKYIEDAKQFASTAKRQQVRDHQASIEAKRRREEELYRVDRDTRTPGQRYRDGPDNSLDILKNIVKARVYTKQQ